MDRSRGLSETEREKLLDQIDKTLGNSPKGKLVREIVESLPSADDSPTERGSAREVVPEAD